jgi:uncharacterized protein YecE (DUF72 family)
MPLYLGCAVWSFAGWLGDLYPRGTRSHEFLAHYSRRLTAVEGNSTFYAIPDEAVLTRWAAETPDGFQFCCKVPRHISHAGVLQPQIAAARQFVDALAPLGTRRGPVFLQLPPDYGPPRLSDLAAFLAAWPHDVPLTVEVRHPGWFVPHAEAALMQLLRQPHLGRVIMDVRPIRLDEAVPSPELAGALERKPDVPMHPLRGGGPTMIRYIGNPQLELNADLLDEWADRLYDWLSEDASTVYFFMHCPDEARSPALCRMLSERLAARGLEAPVLPLPDPLAATQLDLFGSV